MNVNRTETQYQNYAASGTPSTKNNSSESTFDSFQKAIVNWQKRMKDTIDKERENDRNGNIQMSEKQWHNLMKKVDNAIESLQDNNKEKEEEEKQLQIKRDGLQRSYNNGHCPQPLYELKF